MSTEAPQPGWAPRSARDAYQRIYATVDSVPQGRVATYGQIALEAGLPRRARLVGYALRCLPEGSDVPWHRIVNACGQISARGDGGSEREQRARLRAEGVPVREGGRVDLRQYRWAGEGDVPPTATRLRRKHP